MTELSNAFVIAMGMGVVFFGLVCLIAITYLMSSIVRKIAAPKAAPATAPAQTAAPVASAAPAVPAAIPNRPEFIAAVSTAIAEELGEDVSAIRIVSVKRV